MVRPCLRCADPRPGAGLAGHRDRAAHADLCAHRVGQDAGGVPLGAGSAREGADGGSDPPRLRLSPQGALLRRGEEPSGTAKRHRGRREGRHPDRRHAAEGPTGHGPPPARHPHHHPRVAVPDAHEPGGEDVRGHRAGDRGRDPRRRADQARGAPRAHARAPRRGGGPGRPADRAVGHAESARGGRPLPRRPQAHVHDRRHRRAQAARPPDPRARGVDGRARGRRPTRPVRGHGSGGHPQVDLARDLSQAARAGQAAPLDADLRQQPSRRGAPRPAPQRARRREHRPRPPRLAGPRGAAGRGGPAEGGRAAVPGGDLEPRAGHRHGGDRPRAAGRVPQVGHGRPAAHRPRRPQRRRRLQGPHLPEVPGRPARVRGRRPAHAQRRDRDHRRAPQPARRARPADRRHGRSRRRRRAQRRRPVRARHPHAHVRGALASAAGERARHARRPLPVRGVRRAARPHRVGSRGGHAAGPQGRPRAGHHERRHDPRPRAVLRQPA